VTADEAYRRVLAQLPPDFAGSFYAPGDSIGLGKGKIYADLRYPVYNVENRTFNTVEGLAYVVTHECDVEQANDRILNEDVLICPVVPLEHLVQQYQADLVGELLAAFLGNLGARLVSRVAFMPAISGALPFGGVLYLNQITNTHVSAFENSTPVCAVTAFGLRHVEYVLENHLLRPKVDHLAFDQRNG